MKCRECGVVDIPEPRYCCSGADCGCRGLPIDPPFCYACWEKILACSRAAESSGAVDNSTQQAHGKITPEDVELAKSRMA